MSSDAENLPDSPQEDPKKHLSDPEAYNPKDYSDLEVDWRKHFSDPEAVRPGHSTLEVAPGLGHVEGLREDNLQAYHPGVDQDADGAIPYHPGVAGNKYSEGPIPSEKGTDQSTVGSAKKRIICGLSRQAFWLIVFIIVLIVIGAVVGGAVGGTRGGSKSPASSGQSASSSGVDTGIRNDSSLAAVAWEVNSTHYQYRVYYQDDRDSIKESAYDSATGSWTVSTVVDGTGVSPGTSIAATSSKHAVSGSDSTDVNLYFLNSDLDIAVVSSTTGNLTYTPGSSTGKPTTKNAQAKLSAYYLECRLCPNTTLVAYASNGTITLFNATVPEAWSGTALALIDNAAAGSEASFQPYSIANYSDQLNLYYARADRKLVLTSWFAAAYQQAHNLDLAAAGGWQDNGNNAVVGALPAPDARFAALYLGDNNATDSPAFVEVVATGARNDALQVFEWSDNSWNASAARPPQMARGVASGTAVAAHWLQRVYALAEGGAALKQFAVADDGVSWTTIGTVPTL